LRRSTHETRVPHREGNVYGEDHYPTDVLRCPEWRQHSGEADPDMVCRMLKNARRYIQAQPETIPIEGVYYPYSQWNNTVEINGIRYEVDWVGQQPIIIDIERNRMDAPPLAGKSATTAITNHMVCLAREGGAEHICFLLALRATETQSLPKTFKDVAKLQADFVTNFIWPYLYQFFDDSHGLNSSRKPLKRPFDQYQSHLEAISIG